MNELQSAHIVNASIPVSPQSSVKSNPPQQSLPETVNNGVTISAEAQYLFEMNKYLSVLNNDEKGKVLAYLDNSNDPLQRQAANHFRVTQERLNEQVIVLDNNDVLAGPELLDNDFILDESTEVVIYPLHTKIFRFNDAENIGYSRRGNIQGLMDQIDVLEKTSNTMLGAQNTVNLFGTVRNAISVSDIILFSVDDILYFNYMVEKARGAINFFDAPEAMKLSLNTVLDQGVERQKVQQTLALDEMVPFLNNNRIGEFAREQLRVGSAAQNLNNQLQDVLKSTNLSVLNSSGLINKLLVQNVDLIRFEPNKLDEAFSYYQQDFSRFEKILNKDYSVYQIKSQPLLDNKILDIGRNYAVKVIEDIQRYL